MTRETRTQIPAELSKKNLRSLRNDNETFYIELHLLESTKENNKYKLYNNLIYSQDFNNEGILGKTPCSTLADER